jgi:hypothetical protein
VNGRPLIIGGSAVVVVMLVLAMIGTYSTTLFIGYFLVMLIGAAVAAIGYRMEHAATTARLEQEMLRSRQTPGA